MLDEREFHGMESNTVVYVGAGHMEAITRAQLHLFIVTVALPGNNPWYKSYTEAFSKACQENLLVKK